MPRIVLAAEIKRRMELLKLNPKSLSVAAGAGKTAVRDILEGRSRNPRHDTLEKIAGTLGCTVDDLLYGPERAPAARRREDRMAPLVELDVRAGAGNGQIIEREDVSHTWQVPSDLFRGQTSAEMGALRIITVYGDSMEPDLPAGTRVVVDTSDQVPTPPGVFVIWDGLGTVAKRIEFVLLSEPHKIRISSDNARYSAYERMPEEVKIQGRVIGRWRWM